MSRIPFVKVEGLGNDFVVVDLRPGRPGEAAQALLDPKAVRAVCDRHFGVGADGILAISPGVQGDARMRVLNADGSEAEMCGNGIRCVAKLLYEDDPSLRRPQLKIDTGAGLLTCSLEVDGDQVRSVAVEMGKPRLSRGEIPMTGPPDERALRSPVELAGRHFSLTAVSMGNPHAVIFIDDPGLDLRELAESFGPKIETSPVFPRRTNVEFARVRTGAAGPEIDVVVWERGCGITLACGTGACATAVAASMEGRVPAGQETPIHVPGGTLLITVRQERSDPANPGLGTLGTTYGSVLMRGPARRVFAADLDAALLTAQAQGSNQAQR